MRQIGTLAAGEQAERFVDYLLTEGIQAKAEEDGDRWLIWIFEEDDFESSQEALHHFRESPDAARYEDVKQKAMEIRELKFKKIQQTKKNFQNVRGNWQPGLAGAAKRIPATVTLIAVCVAVALWTNFGDKAEESSILMWVSRGHWNPADRLSAMHDILSGQVWRLFTPMLMHLDTIHLLFNMLWLYTLGGQIEQRKGRLKFILMVLALQLGSGLTQAVISNFPYFGGMSGVVYGLFGFIWMKARFDPADGLMISQRTVNLMMIWFIICFLPFFPIGVANGAHAGGLVLGVLMGYISANQR